MSYLIRKAKQAAAKQSEPDSGYSTSGLIEGSQSRQRQLVPVKTEYTSQPVDISDAFLTERPVDSVPITFTKIDFAASPLPEYKGIYAAILDDVISKSECDALLALAEQSAGTKGWQPALLNIGNGYEARVDEARNNDRIVWDNEEVCARLWDRCLSCKNANLERVLGVIPNPGTRKGEMRFSRLNERLRFLRYGPGQYFRAHCDGSYTTPDKLDKSFYTLHLYLNEPSKGGSTTFFSHDEKRKLDVQPKSGRVLIFRHADLLHSGEEVTEGIKYTVRTDLMYKK